MMDRLIKNADNMAKLVDLNEYVDELKTGSQQNLISTRVKVNAKPIWDNNDLFKKLRLSLNPFWLA